MNHPQAFGVWTLATKPWCLDNLAPNGKKDTVYIRFCYFFSFTDKNDAYKSVTGEKHWASHEPDVQYFQFCYEEPMFLSFEKLFLHFEC